MPLQRGKAKIEFLAHRPAILDKLSKGYPAQYIHTVLGLNMSVRQFQRYVKNAIRSNKSEPESVGPVPPVSPPPASSPIPAATYSHTSSLSRQKRQGPKTFRMKSHEEIDALINGKK